MKSLYNKMNNKANIGKLITSFFTDVIDSYVNLPGTNYLIKLLSRQK